MGSAVRWEGAAWRSEAPREWPVSLLNIARFLVPQGMEGASGTACTIAAGRVPDPGRELRRALCSAMAAGAPGSGDAEAAPAAAPIEC